HAAREGAGSGTPPSLCTPHSSPYAFMMSVTRDGDTSASRAVGSSATTTAPLPPPPPLDPGPNPRLSAAPPGGGALLRSPTSNRPTVTPTGTWWLPRGVGVRADDAWTTTRRPASTDTSGRR